MFVQWLHVERGTIDNKKGRETIIVYPAQPNQTNVATTRVTDAFTELIYASTYLLHYHLHVLG